MKNRVWLFPLVPVVGRGEERKEIERGPGFKARRWAVEVT